MAGLVQFPFVPEGRTVWPAIGYGGLARIESVISRVDHLVKSGKKWTLLKR